MKKGVACVGDSMRKDLPLLQFVDEGVSYSDGRKRGEQPLQLVTFAKVIIGCLSWLERK